MAGELVKWSKIKSTDDKTETMLKIRNKQGELKDLYSRMDADRSLAQMDDYVMTDTKGKKVDGVINITMNNPAIDVYSIQSSLLTSIWQTKVISRKTEFKTHVIEQFLDDTDADSDDRLTARGEHTLKEWVCHHVCTRGFIGDRLLYLFDEAGKLYVCDYPLDMRNVAWDYSPFGLAWVAHTAYLSADQVRTEFPFANYNGQGSNIEVIDYWDNDANEIYVGGTLINQSKHLIGYPPFIIEKPSSGYMMRDKGYMKYEAESVLYLNRKLYNEWNRDISIEQTLNQQLIAPPYQKESGDLSGDPASYPHKTGGVTEVLKGEKYELLETKDVNQAHRLSSNVLNGALQRGGVNSIDLGNVGQPTSAVWITEQAEIRAKLLESRLKCLQNFYARRARMKIDMYIKGGYKADLGKTGLKTSYDIADLGDPSTYNIEYTIRSKSKKMEIANLAIAQGARGILPEKVILRDIMEADDPEGILEQLDYEKAEAADPVLFYYRKALSIAIKAENAVGIEKDALNLESMRLTAKGLMMAKSEQVQAQQGQLQAGSPQSMAKPNTNTLMPMLSQPLDNQGTALSGISGNKGGMNGG